MFPKWRRPFRHCSVGVGHKGALCSLRFVLANVIAQHSSSSHGRIVADKTRQKYSKR